MGWASAGDIFDPIAHGLIDLGASEEMKRAILGPLIKKLQGEDWDTEGESLDEFREDPVIVALFRENGVDSDCQDRTGPEHTNECVRKLGHDGDHVDSYDYSWPQIRLETSDAA